ncbi:hypothetical protein [Yersinia proxima]|uniref:hypothetical protein n=1 Tax=Yersinia proxima TaxID=2890316 RepID=UPI001D0FE832|nr:hypothetical protein [Yersinia proxima]
MDITKSQSDFEAWLKSEFIVPASSLTLSPETFKNAVQKAYQAGRESIEVELPPRKSADIESEKYPDMTMYEAMMREGIWNDCIFECGKILRTAGIRIKGNEKS